jgi:hypothetical protein
MSAIHSPLLSRASAIGGEPAQRAGSSMVYRRAAGDLPDARCARATPPMPLRGTGGES